MTIRDRVRWIYNEIGAHVFGVSLMFDLVNACTFTCPSCPVGNSAKRTSGKMGVGVFSDILRHVRSQVRVRYVLLYAFSEPFLHPYIVDIIRECKRQGIRRVMISTNLSRMGNIEAAMAAGLDELRISFSGWDNGPYYHRGRDIKQFDQSCRELSVIAPKYKTQISIIFHKYRDNGHELSRVQSFAKSLGFGLIEETAFFIPFEKIVNDSYTPDDTALIGHLIETPQTKLVRQDYDPICYYNQKQMVIDANGKVFLCRHVFSDSYVVGDIVLDSFWDIRRRMAGHTFCVDCKSCGLNKYTEPE
jgi:MoaA/NifB/PqqE/SkfB family radical SAM enzyme